MGREWDFCVFGAGDELGQAIVQMMKEARAALTAD